MKKITKLITIILMSILLSGCGSLSAPDISTIGIHPDTISNLTVKTNLFGVPDTFTKQTSNERPFNILKGSLTNMRIRPQIINEHAESSREEKSIITPTNSVGQIFRASQDNINTIYLTLESAGLLLLDNFEQYNNSAELQSEWIANSPRLAELESIIVETGDHSMALPGDDVGNEWIKTIPVTDLAGSTGSFDVYFTKEYNKFKVSIFLGDGVNTKSQDLVFNLKDNWIHFDVSEANFIEDQVGITNASAITQVGFRIIDKEKDQIAYIDNIEYSPFAGTVGVELWDMGASLPISGVTSLIDGTQYKQIGDITDTTPVAEFEYSLDGGKRLYHLDNFVAGVALEIPGNEILNVNNYYALVLKYIDSDINVYGPNFDTDYYNSGYGFNVLDNSTPIVTIGGNDDDIMFTIFSTQDVYIIQERLLLNSMPGQMANMMSSLEDENMKTIDVLNSHRVFLQEKQVSDLTNRPVYFPKGGKLNLDYNDDPSDDVNVGVFGLKYLFEPLPFWG
jgi:hypothetical protein